MLLGIDAGNTNIVFAVFNGQALQASWRIRTDSARTCDEYHALLAQLFAHAGLRFDAVDDVVISSVVPDANRHLCGFADRAFQVSPLMVNAALIAPYLDIQIDKPEEAGTDRLMNALAVTAEYQSPTVVVDFGTSTNFDVVLKDGAFGGGVLAPGVNLSASALHAASAKLPRVEIYKPGKAVGTNTVDAIRSGLYWGYIGMIEGLLKRIADEMDEKPFVIATGGLAPVYADGTDMIDIVDDNLTLKGLVRFYTLQTKNRKVA